MFLEKNNSCFSTYLEFLAMKILKKSFRPFQLFNFRIIIKKTFLENIYILKIPIMQDFMFLVPAISQESQFYRVFSSYLALYFKVFRFTDTLDSKKSYIYHCKNFGKNGNMMWSAIYDQNVSVKVVDLFKLHLYILCSFVKKS